MADIDIKDMVWSYSRLTTYETCPYCFKLAYIKDLRKKYETPSAFSQYGSFCHELLEMYFKDDIPDFLMLNYYNEHFTQNVTCDFPPNRYTDLAQKYYKQGQDYFESFIGFEDKYKEILEIETEFFFNVGDYKMKGFIDLAARNYYQQIEIIDHKSKSKPKSKVEKEKLYRQLYLYSIPIFEKYNQWPSRLNFNMFKLQDWYCKDFSIDELEQSKMWALGIIHDVENDTEFNAIDPKKDKMDYWCNFVCGMREICPNSMCYKPYLVEEIA